MGSSKKPIFLPWWALHDPGCSRCRFCCFAFTTTLVNTSPGVRRTGRNPLGHRVAASSIFVGVRDCLHQRPAAPKGGMSRREAPAWRPSPIATRKPPIRFGWGRPERLEIWNQSTGGSCFGCGLFSGGAEKGFWRLARCREHARWLFAAGHYAESPPYDESARPNRPYESGLRVGLGTPRQVGLQPICSKLSGNATTPPSGMAQGHDTGSQ